LKKLIYITVFLLASFLAKGQTLSQTYVDPCDGKSYTVTFSIPNQALLVVIRGQSKVFTYADAKSGVLTTWVTSILSAPCPVVAAQVVATTVANTVSQASSSAASSVRNDIKVFIDFP